METLDRRKIVDTDLQEFAAAENADGRRSVIVELGLPPPTVSPFFSHKPIPRASEVGPHSSPRVSLADVEGHGAAMDELETHLRALGPEARPLRLDSAQAFVVSVTPAQLRTISQWPLAGTIRPNRVHYAPPRR
jgi:hypothetical protein